jgi:hypothetical protein
MSLFFRYHLARAGQPILPLGGRWVHPRPIIPVTLIGPAGTVIERALLDSGSDDTVFPESIAAQIGVDLASAPSIQGTGVGPAVATLRHARVVLRLTDGKERREWTGWVGFTAAHPNRPLLGFAGCLQFFTATFHGDREEVELTANRLYPGT